jgi:hypothetical protein
MRVEPFDRNETPAPQSSGSEISSKSILSTFSTNSSSPEHSDSSTRIRFLLIGKDSSEDVELEESVSVESSSSEVSPPKMLVLFSEGQRDSSSLKPFVLPVVKQLAPSRQPFQYEGSPPPSLHQITTQISEEKRI